MKIHSILLALAVGIPLSGCLSTFGPEIGMTEKQWLHRTLIADVAYMKDNVKAYRSGGAYYYFKDGILVKIDEGMIPAQTINMEIRPHETIATSKSGDIYTELKKLDSLKKEGIITEEEFQAQKKRILEAQK